MTTKNKRPKQIPLSPEELCTIRDMFPHHPTSHIAAILGRHRTSVYKAAVKMGISKTPEFIEQQIHEQKERVKNAGAKYRFSDKNEPFNKGKKLTPEHYENIRKQFFKPGHIPKNTKYDGCETINADGYTIVRTSMAVWELKHRLIWQQHHGPIPKDHNIIFIDGNKRNITIQNLAIVTKEEHLLRNSIHYYPPEIKETIKLLNNLKSKIHAKEQNRRS